MKKFFFLIIILGIVGTSLLVIKSLEKFQEKNSENSFVPAEIAPKNSEQAIKIFVNLINRKNIEQALSVLAQPDGWENQLNSFVSVKLKSIEAHSRAAWTDTVNTYKVELETTMTEESKDAPIPNFGWDNGLNIRFFTVEKVEDSWKISGIGTGP